MAVLKLLQSGTVQMVDVTLSVTVTITSVDTTKAVLIFSYRCAENNPMEVLTNGEITNATTLTFAREEVGEAGESVDIAWYVIEFSSGVTVQRGSQAMSSTPTNISITAVDLAKSFPVISALNQGSTFGPDDFSRAKITTTTNLRLDISQAVGTHIAKWQVVEYDDCAVQTGDISFASGDSSKTATITSVDTNKSWIVQSYTSVAGTGSNIGQKLLRGQVTNATTLTFDRANTGQTMELTWYLVEFTDSTIVQSGSENFGTGDLAKNVTITSVDLAQSFAASAGYYNTGGKSTYSADDIPGVALVTMELTTATNLKLDREITGSVAADIGWFVIEFKVAVAPTPGLVELERHYPRGVMRGVMRGVGP